MKKTHLFNSGELDEGIAGLVCWIACDAYLCDLRAELRVSASYPAPIGDCMQVPSGAHRAAVAKQGQQSCIVHLLAHVADLHAAAVSLPPSKGAQFLRCG